MNRKSFKGLILLLLVLITSFTFIQYKMVVRKKLKNMDKDRQIQVVGNVTAEEKEKCFEIGNKIVRCLYTDLSYKDVTEDRINEFVNMLDEEGIKYLGINPETFAKETVEKIKNEEIEIKLKETNNLRIEIDDKGLRFSFWVEYKQKDNVKGNRKDYINAYKLRFDKDFKIKEPFIKDITEDDM